ncbi:hypothetical protein PK35_11675 [Tamlana nanhaiensis]|uniref:Lipopolysaccharide biosynthesis protein n=1 Tax=Neotamlana nanhaiensis TaxID=1382798 RepID=A0A0D7VYX7_9FLAO|nr:O-antigen translocase [Tamlana nanhaiensis]KJD32090.1 hypothetical protein PK35_10790 [Tamlana nanhaiensis]KJD32252.1 hypothetical protein PK35_11675 [Tamlana nanhaiensis]
MFRLREFIKSNLLLKATSANTFLVLVRMGFSVISQKILAVIVGAEGLAIIGNLKNLVVFLEQLSVLGTTNGLIKYIAEFKDNSKKLHALFSATFVFSMLSTIASFLVLFFFAEPINNYVFGKQNNYVLVIKVLSFIFPFMAVNVILYALLNGLSQYKQYTKITLVSIVLTSVLLVVFTIKWGLMGSLFAIIINPLLQFFNYIFFSRKIVSTYFSFKKVSFSSNLKKDLLSYGGVTLVVVLSVNLTDIIVRNLIENKLNMSAAGYWTAMTSISKTYMQFTAAIFPLYILPKYSQIDRFSEFKVEVKQIYKLLLPLIFLGMFLVFLLRETIVNLLYTREFLEVSDLFLWQLLGDFIKFVAFVLSYQFLAKRRMKFYIFTEVLAVVLFVVISHLLINNFGLKGVVMAHFFRYVIYLVVVVFIFKNYAFGKSNTL